jgi:hypothetical protein
VARGTAPTEERIHMHRALAAATPPALSGMDPVGSDYRPGVCNIGPAEIARRRRVGQVGLIVAIIVLVALLAIGAPPLVRIVIALPAAGAASGYLQAWLRFCAGFGSRGIFNFGAIGGTEDVVDPAARARDRARAGQIGIASLAIGIVAGAIAVLLPLS